VYCCDVDYVECAVKRFGADLELTLDGVTADTCQAPMLLGHVALTAFCGTARLRTNKEVCASYFLVWIVCVAKCCHW